MKPGNDDLFGGIFDFNGDGKTDLGEQFLAYQIFKEVTMKENSDSDDADDTACPPKQAAGYRPPVREADPLPPAQPVPECLSLTEYKAFRRAFFRELFLWLLCVSALCATSGAVIGAAVSSYDAKNSASGFTVMVFVLAGLAVIGFILNSFASGIVKRYQRLTDAKEAYLKTVPAEELARRQKAKKTRTVWIASVLGAGLIAAIALSAADFAYLADAYDNAQALIAAGQYEQAAAVLEEIKEEEYRDTAALLLLCKAHEQYDAGRPVNAYFTMQDAGFRYQTEEQNAEIAAFKEMLRQAYNDSLALQAERDRQEYENRITNGVPYVGMPESRINDTSLGRPSDRVGHNSEMRNGEVYTANLYDFYRDGKRVFTARCVLGTVTEVWDYREEPLTPYVPDDGGKSAFDNEPIVDGFSHPEDFYDWYRDDFFDYEDAEDYYYSHGGA